MNSSVVPGAMTLYAASAIQFITAFANGFLADHPFNCVNSVFGMMLAGVGGYLFFRHGGKVHQHEGTIYWQAYTALGFCAHAVGMLFVYIYSKGSCEQLVEGCSNTATIASIVTLGICSLISMGIFYLLKRSSPFDDLMFNQVSLRFKLVYTTMIVLGALCWVSGITAIDGDGFNTAVGTMCLLGGATTGLVLLNVVRSKIAFSVILGLQTVASVVILIVGCIKEDADENTYMQHETLMTQLLSLANLLIGTSCMLVSFTRQWEFEKEGQQPFASRAVSDTASHVEGGLYHNNHFYTVPVTPKKTSSNESTSTSVEYETDEKKLRDLEFPYPAPAVRKNVV